jgi:hypothetical protein
LGCASSLQAASLSYRFLSDPDFQQDCNQNGTWYVSGEIITDGTLGDLSSSNIVGGYVVLSCSADQPTYTGSITPQSLTYGAFYYSDRGHIHATSLALTIPYGTAKTFISPEIWGGTYAPVLRYNNGATSAGNYEYAGGCGLLVGSNLLWDSQGPLTDEPFDAAAGRDWTIAVVRPIPEPSTFTLLSIAALGLPAYAWRKRRHAG